MVEHIREIEPLQRLLYIFILVFALTIQYLKPDQIMLQFWFYPLELAVWSGINNHGLSSARAYGAYKLKLVVNDSLSLCLFSMLMPCFHLICNEVDAGWEGAFVIIS